MVNSRLQDAHAQTSVYQAGFSPPPWRGYEASVMSVCTHLFVLMSVSLFHLFV